MARKTTTIYAPKSEVARGMFCNLHPHAYIIKVDRIQMLPPKYRIYYEYKSDYKFTHNNKTYTGPTSMCRESCSNPAGKNSGACVAWRQKIRAQNVPEDIKDTVLGDITGGADNGDLPDMLAPSKIAVYIIIGLVALLVLSGGSIGMAVLLKKRKTKRKK